MTLYLETAAFLTQTVTLEDQTTVKFEIWYVQATSTSVSYLARSLGIPPDKNATKFVCLSPDIASCTDSSQLLSLS
jgi:hypothetical protein